MPHTLHTAPPAAGKTAHAVALARAGRSVRVAVATPQQKVQFERRLAKAGGALNVRVTTFGELYADALSALGKNVAVLTAEACERWLASICASTELTHYARIQHTPGFVQVLGEVIAELKAERVHPDALAMALDKLDASPRLRELGLLFSTYQDQVREHEWADNAGRAWLATEALEHAAPGALPWPVLILDGIDTFTSVQTDWLRAAAAHIPHIAVTLSQYPDSPQYRDTLARLEHALGCSAQPLPNPFVPPAPHAAFLEVSDRSREAREAVRWLKQRIVHDGVPPAQCAVLARNLAPYADALRTVAAEMGVPLHCIDGVALASNPLIGALINLLQLAPGFAPPALLAALRSPYFGWPAFGWTDGDVQHLRSLAAKHNVIEGLPQWRAALQVGQASQREATEAMQAKFEALVTQLTPPTGRRPLPEHVRWLERLIGGDDEDEIDDAQSLHVVAAARANHETAARDVRALRALKDALRSQCVAHEITGGQMLDPAGFLAVLMAAINGATYDPDAVAMADGVFVCDIPRARGLRFAAVAVIGMAEGEFPRASRENPLLTDADRQQLSSATGRRLSNSLDSAEQDYFLASLSRGERDLLFMRPRLADNGAEWLPSVFWSAAMQRFATAGVTTLRTGQLPEADAAASTVEAALVTAGTSTQTVTAQPAGDLAAQTASLQDMFDDAFTWSASALETYAECPYWFYIERVLKVRQPVSAVEGVDAAITGMIYHDALRMLAEHLRDAPDDQAGAGEKLDQLLEDASEKHSFRASAWWAQSRHVLREDILRNAAGLAAGWTPLQLEQRFERLELAPGVWLKGAIDRIDTRPDGAVRVVDYKLGRPKVDDVATGRMMQVALYARAAEALTGKAVTHALYWHLGKAEPAINLADDIGGGLTGAIEIATRTALAAVEGVRSGRFSPTPPDDGCAPYCPAAGFCARYQPRRTF